jgi:hypothetical protein
MHFTTAGQIMPRVPITFDPGNVEHLREVEEVNGIGIKTIKNVRWIKPLERRCLDQMHAFTIFTITLVESANLHIRDGLNICRTKMGQKRQKIEPVQCMKCRQWGHFAMECQLEMERHGTYGEVHHTNACNTKGKLSVYLATEIVMLAGTETTWNSKGDIPCTQYDEHNLENSMPYYPTEQAHVAYVVIVVSRAHMQISWMYWEKQHGPILSNKSICLYGPMKTCYPYSHIGPSLNTMNSQL